MTLAAKEGRTDNEVITLPVGRQDMADYLGLTIETTSRSLSDLKAARLISTPNRFGVVIRNFVKLEAVAQGDN